MNIKTDSRKVVKGDTFVAMRGVLSDGHSYIKQAIKNGASMIVAETGDYDVPTIIVKDTRDYLTNYLKDKYEDTLKDITFIGITGTNGKTTSGYLTYKMLNLLGKKTAYIGTIGFYIEDEVEPLSNTTPDVLDLYEMFLKCKDRGIEVIVMEVSSHALSYGRVDGIMYDYAVFTNLTQDHLDYHKTMNEYMGAKQKLFMKIKKDGYAIINGDDSYYKNFITDNNNIIYGFSEEADYKVLDYELKIDETTFDFKVNENTYHSKNNLVGKYNIYNYLVCLIIANKIGYKIEDILTCNKSLPEPPGRMEGISYNNAMIFVDYAHTPDAISNVLNSVNSYKEGRVITIVGCGGDRDKTKRPIMGDVSTKLSDYVIFTNDNPRTEDAKAIMDDIVNNLNVNNYEIIYDRKKAIEKGIDILEEKDILLILGKGHENYQIIGKEKHHHDDNEYAKRYIEGKQEVEKCVDS